MNKEHPQSQELGFWMHKWMHMYGTCLDIDEPRVEGQIKRWRGEGKFWGTTRGHKPILIN